MCRETTISCVLDLPFSFGAKNARFLGDTRFFPGIDISLGDDMCFFVFPFCAHHLSRALDFLYPCNEGCSFAGSTCSKNEFINHD